MASSTYRPVLSRPALAGIGDRLREMFDAMTAGPLPDHIVDIVDQLEAQAAAPEQGAERACLNPA